MYRSRLAAFILFLVAFQLMVGCTGIAPDLPPLLSNAAELIDRMLPSWGR